MFSPARIIKGILLFVLLAFTASMLPPHSLAYTPTTPNRLYSQPNLDPEVANDQHTKIQTLIIDTMAAVMCQMVGVDPVRPQQGCVTFNVKSGTFAYVTPDKTSGGLLGTMGRMIGSTYQIPVHTEDYTSYLASNFGVVRHTLAADGGGGGGSTIDDPSTLGSGFNSMRSLIGIWTKLRDLAYLTFVIVFVLIGLGIMLRVKIDPRTVMSIQNQIPRIVISILLITFSYAIAGFLIDVMWLSTYLGINVIASQAPAPCDPDNLTSVATNNLLTTPMHYVGAIFKVDGCPVDYGIKEIAFYVGQTVGDVIVQTVLSIFGGDGESNCTLSLSWNVLDCVGDVLFSIWSAIVGVVAALIIAIAIFAALFRVWFALLKSMIYVIMYTIMAPLWILLGLLPNTKNFGFEQWLRHMVGGLAPFPATALLYVAAAVIANDPGINQTGTAYDVNGFFLPPLVANPNISENIGMAIAFGIILISPEIVNMVRDAFKVSSSKYVGSAVTGGAAAGYALAGAAVSPMAKNLFGKQKDGTWGPLTYYAGRWAAGRYPNVANKIRTIKTALNKPRMDQLKNKQYVLGADGNVVLTSKNLDETPAQRETGSPGVSPASGSPTSTHGGDESDKPGEAASGAGDTTPKS